jgi:hypothetical protein
MRNSILTLALLLLTGCATFTPSGQLRLDHPANVIKYNPKFPVDNTGCKQIYYTSYAYARWYYHDRDYYLYPTNNILRCVDYSSDPEYQRLFHVWMLASIFPALFVITP